MKKRYGLVDLHLHLDGSISLSSARRLAAMQGIVLPESDSALFSVLKVNDDCKDLNEYLEKFEFPLRLLQTKESLSQAVRTLLSELAEEGLIYAEIRFAPQLHLQKGMTQEDAVKAALCGMEGTAIPATLILCCMRGKDNAEENFETVRIAARYLNKGVGGVDLAGAEALFPTSLFENLFKEVKERGVPFTIHAGEADGPESVSAAVNYGARRIGHGVRSVENQALIQRLTDDGVVLELCPTSNLHTGGYCSLEDYPIRTFLQAGVKVTLNTDNKTVSDTTLEREFEQLRHTFALSEEQLMQMTKNAVDASFADEETKKELYARLSC